MSTHQHEGDGSRRRVALLSNYRTRNLGNLALTTTMQRVLERRYGVDQVVRCHRAPHPVVELVARGPVEQWSRRLEDRIGPVADGSGDRATPGRAASAEVTTTLAPRGVESRTQPVWRRAAARLGRTRPVLEVRARSKADEARTHYGRLLSGDDVVWVPGGEIFAGGHPRNRLLDVCAAVDHGKAVAMVNFSFEPSPETLRAFRSLARRVDLTAVRDLASGERLADAGVPVSAIVRVPDAVFLLGTDVVPDVAFRPGAEPADGSRSDTIGLVLHGIQSLDDHAWADLVRALRAEGLRVQILSSHKEHDGAVIASLLAALPDGSVEVADEFTDIETYLAHLSSLRGVVTARFHSAVMGIVAGIRVAGVDTYGTKVAGGLVEAGFGSHVASGSEWPEVASSLVTSAEPASSRVLDDTRTRILDAYDSMLPLRSSPPG